MSDVEYIEVAKILNEAAEVAALNESMNFVLPLSARDMKEFRANIKDIKLKAVKIYITGENEATDSGSSGHSARIKCGVRNRLAEIPLAPDKRIANKGYGKNSEELNNIEIARRFAKDNVGALYAFWYCDDLTEDSPLYEAFRKYFRMKLGSVPYYKSSSDVGAKSREEMEKEEAELLDFLRKELNDPSFTLRVAKKKGDDSKSKSKKRK